VLHNFGNKLHHSHMAEYAIAQRFLHRR